MFWESTCSHGPVLTLVVCWNSCWLACDLVKWWYSVRARSFGPAKQEDILQNELISQKAPGRRFDTFLSVVLKRFFYPFSSEPFNFWKGLQQPQVLWQCVLPAACILMQKPLMVSSFLKFACQSRRLSFMDAGTKWHCFDVQTDKGLQIYTWFHHSSRFFLLCMLWQVLQNQRHHLLAPLRLPWKESPHLRTV